MLSLFVAAALATTAAAQSASPRDCAQEAEVESQQCISGWLGMSSCDGGMIAAMFNLPPSQGGFTCDEKFDHVLEAHDDYRDATYQDIAPYGPSSALDSVGRCATRGEYTCIELQVLANETDAFIDDIDFCDQDQSPVFDDFVADIRATWWDLCVDTSLASQGRVR